MKAKEFEEICLYRLRQHEERGEATMSRYGVQASFIDGKWQPLQSLPDFEGVLPGGRQFIFDAKVCGQPSFPLYEDKFKRRQLRHLMKRSEFGAICFLLLHFTERHLKKTYEEAVTWAFPVYRTHPLWLAFDRGETKRIRREDCDEYAARVIWDCLPGGAKRRPNILAAIYELASCALISAGNMPFTFSKSTVVHSL